MLYDEMTKVRVSFEQSSLTNPEKEDILEGGWNNINDAKYITNIYSVMYDNNEAKSCSEAYLYELYHKGYYELEWDGQFYLSWFKDEHTPYFRIGCFDVLWEQNNQRNIVDYYVTTNQPKTAQEFINTVNLFKPDNYDKWYENWASKQYGNSVVIRGWDGNESAMAPMIFDTQNSYETLKDLLETNWWEPVDITKPFYEIGDKSNGDVIYVAAPNGLYEPEVIKLDAIPVIVEENYCGKDGILKAKTWVELVGQPKEFTADSIYTPNIRIGTGRYNDTETYNSRRDGFLSYYGSQMYTKIAGTSYVEEESLTTLYMQMDISTGLDRAQIMYVFNGRIYSYDLEIIDGLFDILLTNHRDYSEGYFHIVFYDSDNVFPSEHYYHNDLDNSYSYANYYIRE